MGKLKTASTVEWYGLTLREGQAEFWRRANLMTPAVPFVWKTKLSYNGYKMTDAADFNRVN